MTTTNDWDLTPEQRWRAMQAAADAADPWRDHSRTLTRSTGGSLVQGPPKTQPATPERISDEAYNKLTTFEKIQYARQFPQ